MNLVNSGLAHVSSGSDNFVLLVSVGLGDLGLDVLAPKFLNAGSGLAIGPLAVLGTGRTNSQGTTRNSLKWSEVVKNYTHLRSQVRGNATEAHGLFGRVKRFNNFLNSWINGTVGPLESPIGQVFGGAETAYNDQLVTNIPLISITWDNKGIKVIRVELIERFDITTGNSCRFDQDITIVIVRSTLSVINCMELLLIWCKHANFGLITRKGDQSGRGFMDFRAIVNSGTGQNYGNALRGHSTGDQ